MLTNLALFRAKPGQAEALGVALTDLVEPTTREAGCVCYDFTPAVGDGSPVGATYTTGFGELKLV